MIAIPVVDLQGSGSSRLPENRGDDPVRQFVSVVLDDTEDVWKQVFKSMGRNDPKLVLYSNRVSSACGLASAASGSFYCPEDKKAYLDLSFFNELDQRFGAPGQFARAYVIAHEYGHHIQNLLGAMDRRGGPSRGEGSDSVRTELRSRSRCATVIRS